MKTLEVTGYFSANAISRVIDVLKKESHCCVVRRWKGARGRPDQGQDALDKLAAAGVRLQQVGETRAELIDALEKEARRQDFVSIVALTRNNLGRHDAGDTESELHQNNTKNDQKKEKTRSCVGFA